MIRQKPITDEMVLAHMEPGVRYSIRRIAIRLQCRDERVRAKLQQMVEAGKIAREREGGTECRSVPFEYFIDAEPTKVAGGEFECPTRPVHINLTGTLTGYDAEFSRRRDLCMRVTRIA